MRIEPRLEYDKRRKTWNVRYMDASGRRKRDEYHYRNKAEAKMRRSIIGDMLIKKSLGQVDDSRSVEDCFRNFVAEKQNDVSMARIHNYDEAFRLFMRVVKVKSMAEITRRVILDFKAELFSRKFSEHTIHGYLGAIAVWLKWAKLNEWIHENPHNEISAPIPKPVDRFLTDNEVLKMEAVITNAEFRCIFRLGYMVGLRPHEIAKMDAEHLVASEIPDPVNPGKKITAWTLGIPPGTKTGARMVVVPPMVMAFWPKREGRIFAAWNRHRIARHFKWALQKASLPIMVLRTNMNKKEVEVRRIFYWTRHTYARRYLQKGGSLRVLSLLLGHASIKITADTYGHLEKTFVIDQAHAINAVIGNVETILLAETCGQLAGNNSSNVVTFGTTGELGDTPQENQG